MSHTITDNRYQLINQYGEIYNIVNGTCIILEESGTIELDKVEKSYLEGAVVPGIQRDMSKQITFQIDVNNETDDLFRTEYNELITRAREAIIIRDRKLLLQTSVRLVERGFAFDSGGELRGGTMSLTFDQITPFWEELTYREETIETGDLVIENNGNLPTAPIIIMEVPGEPVTRFLVKVVEDNFGIGISDLAFGSQGLNTYLIDCESGEITLNGILRNQKILPGTGFFQLRRGQNTLRMKTTNDSISMAVRWKQRYWI